MKETTVFPKDPKWEGDGTSRVPFWAYTREDLYKKELDKFFYSDHWCYVGLEAEIPNPGDFRRTVVGERSVVMVRDPDGGINVVEVKLRKNRHVKSLITPEIRNNRFSSDQPAPLRNEATSAGLHFGKSRKQRQTAVV